MIEADFARFILIDYQWLADKLTDRGDQRAGIGAVNRRGILTPDRRPIFATVAFLCAGPAGEEESQRSGAPGSDRYRVVIRLT